MNFQKLFDDYKVDYNTRVNKGWVNVTCPFCDDRTYNGGFKIKGDYYHCWKCGGHNIRQTLSMVLHVPQHRLDEVLIDYQGRGLLHDLGDTKVAKATKIELPSNELLKNEREYLQKRNFDADFLREKYGIVGGGISGPWAYRIIIPLYQGGRLVSWTGRSILSKKKIDELKIPRYKNLSIEQSVINPKHGLFNLDNANKKTVVLTEGAFDVMRLGDDFICSFGTELTQQQIKVIGERFKKVFIMFDNEVEAQKKARKFGLQLTAIGLDVEVVDAYSDFGKNDGGELNEKEVKIIRKELGI